MGTPKTVAKLKSQAWNEFGEAMENNFWMGSKLFWQTVWWLKGGDDTMHKLY